MAVEHIVLLKWKPGLTPAQIKHQMDGVLALRRRIPNLTMLQAGKPFKQMPDDADWDCAILMVFPSPKDLEHWATCDDHTAYAKTLMPDVEKYLVVDFER